MSASDGAGPFAEGEKRAAFRDHAREQLGIDEALIRRVVHTFYGAIRRDRLLGPIFDARIADWPTHLERMEAFWSSVMLMSGRYHGQPMVAHANLPIDSAHFDRWLRLFDETVAATCDPPAAGAFRLRARTIAESLELGVAARHGRLLARGERFSEPG